MERLQESFCPLDYGFCWTADGWYTFPYKEAHKAALAARNLMAKKLRAAGWKVTPYTHRNQLMSMGGIGSGNPHIELIVNCYGLNAEKP